MSDWIVFDKVEYHLAGDFPDDLDSDQAFVPTGFFVAWMILRGLASPETIRDFTNDVQSLRQRTATPSSIYRALGGVFESRLLIADGLRFTEVYFDFDTGTYLDDLDDVLGSEVPTYFHIADTWDNFDKLVKRLDERFSQWHR